MELLAQLVLRGSEKYDDVVGARVLHHILSVWIYWYSKSAVEKRITLLSFERLRLCRVESLENPSSVDAVAMAIKNKQRDNWLRTISKILLKNPTVLNRF